MAGEKWTVETLKELFDRVLIERDAAIKIAEDNAEKWRASANEWRGAMNDRERQFLTKEEFNEYRRTMDKLLMVEKERADKLEGKHSGISQFIGWILAGVTILAFILNNLLKK